MKGLTNFASAIILLFIIISLFPILYSIFNSEAYTEKSLVAEALSSSIKRGEIKLGYKLISTDTLLVYNFGSHSLSLDKVLVNGQPRNVSVLVFNGSTWIRSDSIPPSKLGIITFDEPVDNYLTLVVNGTFYSMEVK